MHIERTLIVFKPDAVQRGIVGEILSRFERAGLKLVGLKMAMPSRDHVHHHYETIGKVGSRVSEKVLEGNIEFMTSGPVVAGVLEGVEAVTLVRKMVGSTEPKAAAPGTIRGDYTHISYARADVREIAIPNVLHASGDADEAKLEIAHWFNEGELFEYETVHEKHTR